MTYRHLTLEERHQIEALRKLGIKPSEIARRLGRDPSTVSREVRRNGTLVVTGLYRAGRAQGRATARRTLKGARARKIQGSLRALIEEKLRLSWSPEQISGRLLLDLGVKISHETIYQHVLRDSKKGGPLRYCLRFGGYRQHRFKKSRMAVRTRARKNWIANRPVAANKRSELGHWERDCVLGRRGGAALLTFVDRKSRLSLIRKVSGVNVAAVEPATINALGRFRNVNKTVTNDNGIEFQRDEDFQERLGLPIYFTEPSSPWQRGSVENLNGLVRQYVPKHSDIDSIDSSLVGAIELTLNFRPRKTLNYLTPYEAFFGEKLNLSEGKSMHFGLEFSRVT